MQYLGDYEDNYATLNFTFTTRTDATDTPAVLAGSPVISVYKGSATGTEKTSAEAYITLDIDFDGKVGLNHVLIDLSADAFFVVAEDYYVVITTGTVGTSRVGTVVAHFSIENRAPMIDIASIIAAVITNAAGTDVAADIIEVKAETAAIVLDTVELGAAVGADFSADIAAIKAETVLILADTDDIGVAGAGLTDLGGMSTGMKAEVNVEAKDVLDTDTHAEPAQGTPGATISTGAKIDFLYKFMRNRNTQTATQHNVYNDDATTIDHKRTVSDNGTTADMTEVITGP
ncbi:hypothetical protein LCGC14_1177860 [marine sediment metagenome]|uniref:Uncharacterized protein n=1 Tax=marine sediment metagenome TaxID=412755 RepID=A0A0F9P5Y7_9ZZZZ